MMPSISQFIVATLFLAVAMPVSAQPEASSAPRPVPATGGAAAVLPADYVIGPEDVLGVVFWSDREMAGDVTVRPDGKISIPLLNDVQAAGLTPEQLRAQLERDIAKFLAEPTTTVVVRTINSRKVHIVGNVVRAGTYPLNGDLNVLQFIALAGGLQEYADAKNITIIRKEGGQDRPLKFNFKDVSQGKNLQQNVSLKPGDTVIVP